MSNIKMIKKDAAIQVVISSGFLQKIQAIVVYMVNERSDEELAEFQKLAMAKEDLTLDWMEHLSTMMLLMNEIETKAEEQGFTYDADINQLDS
jgi:hypothetical protein